MILCLLEVRYRFRVQIFANTLLSVRRRSEGGTPSQNLGSPQICPRQIFAYWYSGSAFIPRFSPVLRFFRVLSMIFTTSSSVFDINVLLLCCYRLSLAKRLLTREGTRISTIFIEAECIKNMRMNKKKEMLLYVLFNRHNKNPMLLSLDHVK